MTFEGRSPGDLRFVFGSSGKFQLEDAWRLAAQVAEASGPLRLHLDLSGCSTVDVDGLALLCRCVAPKASEIRIHGLSRPDLRAFHDLGVFLDERIIVCNGTA